MKINSTTKVTGEKVILVPYREHHVPKYHEWMSSEELQLLTASEPLSLEQEYEMQKEWLLDEDKLTFIVLSKSLFNNSGNSEESAMIGDVNVFFSNCSDTAKEVELDVMIAEKAQRGYGYGIESVCLMMYYCLLNFSRIDTFFVKINEDNIGSIKMFEKLGFVQYDYLKAFKQICMKFVLQQNRFESIENQYFNTKNVIIDTNHI